MLVAEEKDAKKILFAETKDEQMMKNLLKMTRWQTGMKQYELAIKLHCSAPYLSLIENGRVDPPEEFKERAAQFFKVAVEEIFPEAERVERILIMSTQENELSIRSSHINF